MSRCLLVVAAAGYGKTTALEAEGVVHRAVDVDPAALPEDRPLVIDDLDDLDPQRQRDLLAALPARTPVWLGSGSPLGVAVLAGLRRPVSERGPRDLALRMEQVAAVLRDEHGIDDAGLAPVVHAHSGGWAELVHVLADDVPGVLAEPSAALVSWVQHRLLARLPQRTRAALAAAAQLDPVCPPLLPQYSDELTWLQRTGILLPHPDGHGEQVVPAVRAVLRLQAGEPVDLAGAAAWYERNGWPLAAAQTHARLGNTERAADLVAAHATRLLARGAAADVAALAVGERRAVALVKGDALRIIGDTSSALRVFAPLLRERVDAALAWRTAMVHYLDGHYDQALAVCERAAPSAQPDSDDVHLAAVHANVLAMLGRADEAARRARQAVLLAAEVGDDHALAAAHIASANAVTGRNRDLHLARARAASERAGDVLQLARVLVNQADASIREARFGEAVELSVRAVRAAERGSPPGLLATALCTAGDALLRTGQFDEAAFQFERAVALCRARGLGRLSMGLWGRAEVYRVLGHHDLAAGGFQEAIELAAERGDVQVLVPALAGHVRLLLASGDLAAAHDAAARAERVASPEALPQALLARGWVALSAGELDSAQRYASAAAHAAREQRCADGLAESVELAALASPDPARRRELLTQALELWEASGARPSADRMRVLLARAPGADPRTRAQAKVAARRLLDLGVRSVDGLSLLPDTVAVRIQVLGEFAVSVDGRPVAVQEWKSRQARTLVKVLVARRGRPIPRLELRELLWPDDDPERTAHRLSVLLSTLRSVFDPAKAWPADHFLRADQAAIGLDLAHVAVDVEDFLRDAAHVLSETDDGDLELHLSALRDVDLAYTGDAFPDEPYDDWADGLREQARSTWLQVLRRLAARSEDAGDVTRTVTTLARLLDCDPYDESAYAALVRVLVAAGQHGEARRAFARWTRAMRAIDAPLPDERVLAAR